MGSNFWTFIRAFGGSWLTTMSGGLSVLFALGSPYAPPWLGEHAALYLGIAGGIFAGYRVWKAEREKVLALSPERVRVRNISGHKTADIFETDEMIVAESAGGPTTLFLPKSPKHGTRIEIKAAASTVPGNSIFIDGNGSTIDGQKYFSLHFANQAITLTFTLSGWMIS